MLELTLRKIGNSYGVILPQEALAQLSVSEGDKITATPITGGYTLRAGSSDFDRAMRIAEEGMKRYRNTLQELAK